MLSVRLIVYSIRVGPGGEVLEAAFSGRVPTEEALRAVSQGFALAEAGNTTRAIVDVRAIEERPASLMMLAATFAHRFGANQRIAIFCDPGQLPVVRRFARFAGIGPGLGVFTRPEDAVEWLMNTRVQRYGLPIRRQEARPGSERASAAQPPVARSG